MIGGHWFAVRDGDPRALALFLRHYSAWKSRHGALRAAPGNAERIVGPGERMVLLTQACDALFVWRLVRFRKDGQDGVNCAVFRNEGQVRSSLLIGEATELAWQRWPGQRLFTFVDPSRVRSTNPGFCFLAAGWRRCGRTARGLVILERLPRALEAAA